jgi:hypothetical protein
MVALVAVNELCDVKREKISMCFLYQLGSYCTFDLEYLPSLVEMKQTCAWKFVHRSYIGGDISDQNYLEETVSLYTMTSFSL